MVIQPSLFAPQQAFEEPPPAEFTPGIAQIARETPSYVRRFNWAFRWARRAVPPVWRHLRSGRNMLTRSERANKKIADVETKAKAQPPTGHPESTLRRGVPTWRYILYVLVIAAIWYGIDQNVLLPAGLSLATTKLLAAGLVLVQLGAAHTHGSVQRRLTDVPDPDTTMRSERNRSRAALVVGIGTGIAVAVVRANGRPWVGLLFALLEIALFIWASQLSYRHESYLAAEYSAARGEGWWTEKGVEYHAHGAERCNARLEHRCSRFQNTVRHIVHRVDTIEAGCIATFKRNHPEETVPTFPEPAWMATLRAVAAGDLPEELTVRRFRQLGEGEAA